MDFDAYEYHAASGSWIAKDFKHGQGFSHGLNCIIDPDVVVGDNVRLGHPSICAAGTRFLDDIEFADDCVTTGITLSATTCACAPARACPRASSSTTGASSPPAS